MNKFYAYFIQRKLHTHLLNRLLCKYFGNKNSAYYHKNNMSNEFTLLGFLSVNFPCLDHVVS